MLMTAERPAEADTQTAVPRDSGAFRRYATSVALSGEWIPWSEFVASCWAHLVRDSPVTAADRRSAAKTLAGFDRDAGGLWRPTVKAADGRPEGRPADDAELDDVRAEYVRAWAEGARDRRTSVEDEVGAWRMTRPAVLTELDALGLAATVERTDGPLALADHEADLAGLVRVHRAGGTATNVTEPHADSTVAAYRARMAERFGLVPADGIPRSLRGFCGQTSPTGTHTVRPVVVDVKAAPGTLGACTATWRLSAKGVRETDCSTCGRREMRCPGRPVETVRGTVWRGYRPSWMDHTHAWLDRDGDPVLTTEPYAGFDPMDVVRDLEGLPLTAWAVRPGLWNDGTVLVMLRWDPDAEVLPAEAQLRRFSTANDEWAAWQ